MVVIAPRDSSHGTEEPGTTAASLGILQPRHSLWVEAQLFNDEGTLTGGRGISWPEYHRGMAGRICLQNGCLPLL